jgi:hypothetical protein
MRARNAIALCVVSFACAGTWGCNAVLGINDPQRAEDAGLQPGSDASSEQAEAAPDGPGKDDGLPDSEQPDGGPDQGSPDAQPDQTPTEAGEDALTEAGEDALTEAGEDALTEAGEDAPVETGGDAGLIALNVGLGDEHGCAVMSSGEVRCWGRGIDGQLGNGQALDQHAPVTVYAAGTTPLTAAQQVKAGYINTCALLPGGLKCWGDNGKGVFWRRLRTTTWARTTSVPLHPARSTAGATTTGSR